MQQLRDVIANPMRSFLRKKTCFWYCFSETYILIYCTFFDCCKVKKTFKRFHLEAPEAYKFKQILGRFLASDKPTVAKPFAAYPAAAYPKLPENHQLHKISSDKMPPNQMPQKLKMPQPNCSLTACQKTKHAY